MEESYKIFVDFNNSDSKGRVRLNTKGSFDDIQRDNIQLKEGLKILLDDGDGLVTSGIVQFSDEENIWVAEIDWNSFG